MFKQFMVAVISVCGLWMTVLADDLPLLPPARLMGHVQLDGQPVVNMTDARIQGVKDDTVWAGVLDTDGKYRLDIPHEDSIAPGDPIQLWLYFDANPVARHGPVEIPGYGQAMRLDLNFVTQQRRRK